MTFERDVFSYAIECECLVKLLRLSIIINFTKGEDNISQLGDYDAPFCEHNTRMSLVKSLCLNSNHLIS